MYSFLGHKNVRDERDATGRIVHDKTKGGLHVSDCGILVIRSIHVISLTSERVVERTPLIATPVGFALDNAFLHVRLLLVTGIADVHTIGLSGSTERVHDLVGHSVVLAGVKHESDIESSAGDPTSHLEVLDGNGIAIGESSLRTAGDVGRSRSADNGSPTTHIGLDSLVDKTEATLTGTDDELALLEVNLTLAYETESVLKEAEIELVIILNVTGILILTQTGTLLVGKTGKTEVGVLAIVKLGGNTTLKGVALILLEGLLKFPGNCKHPPADGLSNLTTTNLAGKRNIGGKTLAKFLSTDLVLDTYTGELTTHGDRGAEPDVTNLAGEVVLNGSIAPAEPLTGLQELRRYTLTTVGTERLYEINVVRTFDTGVLLDDKGINLIERTPENFTKGEPVLREYEIERLEAYTRIVGALVVDGSTVAIPCLNERDVPVSRGNDIVEKLGVVLILTHRDFLSEIGIDGGEMHTRKQSSHNITRFLRILCEETVDMIVLRDSTTPSGYANSLARINLSWHSFLN